MEGPSVLICLLGLPQLRMDDGAVHSLNLKDAALLALLALDGPQARGALGERVWPDSNSAKAAGSLRQRISRLRRSSSHRLVETGDPLRLAAGVRCDVWEIGMLPVDQLLGASGLLAGSDFGANEFLDSWVRRKREQIDRDLADAMAGQSGVLEKCGKLADALRLSERILALTPLHEHACRRHMRLHYLRGDHAAAIQAFERFELALREETGTRPSPETCELLRLIEQADSALPAKPTRVPESLLRPPKLVGRTPELKRMEVAWAGSRNFVLMAEAGMGKSRLLLDFLNGLPGVVFEQARPGDAQTPYAVLARALRGVLAANPVTLGDQTRQELARLLPELGTAPVASGQQGTLWRAVEHLLAGAVDLGLRALAIDDLHFCDVATLDAMRWLSASTELAQLRLGLAARTDAKDPIATYLRDWSNDTLRLEPIVLRPLSRTDIDDLVDSIQLPAGSWPSLGEQLFRHAGGHPFFTLETLKDCLRDNSVGQARFVMRVPSSAQSLLERRLRELSPEAQDLLRVAAVCGEDLNAPRAARLLAVRTVDLAKPWSELESANVLRGPSFAHDLMRESAIRLVPDAVSRVLHATVAEVLVGDSSAPPGRVAEHWEAAQRWSEAARCWHSAGLAARYAGRLVEQKALLERAADCYRRTGDVAGEFRAIHDGLDSVLVRAGGAALLDELSRLDPLANSAELRLKAMLLRVEALLDLTKSHEAAEVSTAAVALAREESVLLADALCLHSMALAQAGRLTDAVSAGREGEVLARSSGDKPLALRAARSLAYVFFSANQIHEAAKMQRLTVELARSVGDSAELTLGEGNLATFLTLIGEPRATYEHAVRARAGHEAMGSSVNGTQGGLDLVNLGSAAAYLGRFGEALQALGEAVQILDERSSPAASAKARIAMAGLWLTLGCADAARESLSVMPSGAPSIMQVQWHLTLARAATVQGSHVDGHLARATELLLTNRSLPQLPAIWYEWFRYGEPRAAAESLAIVRAECEAQKQHGAARTLALREITRRLELPAIDLRDLVDRATALIPDVGLDFHVSTYPPEAWLVLAQAHRRAGLPEVSSACRAAAVTWLRERALPNVPLEFRESFLTRNPTNRVLVQGGERF